jgi:hypothetical protein
MSPKLTSMTQMIIIGLAIADDRGGVGEVLKGSGDGMAKASVPCSWQWRGDEGTGGGRR